MEEIWKPIIINGIDYTGLYEVSNLGNVRSLDRIDNLGRKKKGKILKLSNNNIGYVQVLLLKDGKRKLYKVHRLVATVFIPNPNNLPEVNHKDEDKTNNTLSNLEWCDRKYNINYGTARQRQTELMKGKHHTEEAKKKMSEAQKGKHYQKKKKVYCVELDREFPSAKEASEIIGIHYTCISKCCKGKLKTTGGYHWYYFENILFLDNKVVY